MPSALTTIELHGFKSFAGRETLDVDDRIVGIVGPNGSGKSNIVDALRWVLGERRAEHLRGEALDNLIFAGTSKRPRSSLTRVSVVIRNEGGLFPVEADEVCFERRVSREGVSRMYLNGAEIRLGEALEMLAGARLGPRSFGIVGQGDADLFVRADANERRAMIEELLGLNKFRMKKRTAEGRLHRARENMAQVSAQLGELEPHMALLRRQRKKWEKREEIEKKLKNVAAAYFGNRQSELDREHEKVSARIEKLLEEKEKKETNVRELKKETKRAESALSASGGEAGKSPGSSSREIVESVRDFVREMEAALKENSEGAVISEVKKWVKRFGRMLKSGGSGSVSDGVAEFKEAVSHLEKAKSEVYGIESEIQDARFELEKVKMRQDELKREMAVTGLSCHPDPALDAGEGSQKDSSPRQGEDQNDNNDNPEEARAKIYRLQAKLASIGEIDEDIVEEAMEAEERYKFLSEQVSDLEKACRNLCKAIDDLDRRIRDDFTGAFANINKAFAGYFKMMFGGGKARLKESGGPEPGVELDINMPGKRAQGIDVLSGGEKSLVSLAALFALISVSPPPFLVLDEIDAALDDENASRFSELLKKFSESAQFIVVTHNRITMNAVGTLYGVTMGEDGVSKIFSMKL